MGATTNVSLCPAWKWVGFQLIWQIGKKWFFGDFLKRIQFFKFWKCIPCMLLCFGWQRAIIQGFIGGQLATPVDLA